MGKSTIHMIPCIIITFCLLRTNIPLSIMFSNILRLKDQFSGPYKTSGKIIVFMLALLAACFLLVGCFTYLSL